MGRLLAAVALSLLVTAQPAGGQRIVSYDVAVTVGSDGTMAVVETIDYDFGADARHGIQRDVPVRYHFDRSHDRVLTLDGVVAQVDGTRAEVQESDQPGGLHRIRIGDPSTTVTGRHFYVLRYQVAGALNHFADHDELYWNAVGQQWAVPIDQAAVRLTMPAAIQRMTCFAGPAGSSLPCAGTGRDGPTAHFTAAGLGPGEGLTVVAGIPVGAVSPVPRPILEDRPSLARSFRATAGTLAGSAAVLALVLAALARALWRAGRDRRWVGSPVDAAMGNDSGAEQPVGLFEDRSVPVELEPPDGARPGQVGTLIDEAANPLDVTATIVDLAVRGHLRIEEVPEHGWFAKRDWTLVKLDGGKGGGELRPYESALLGELLEGRDEVRLSQLRNTFATRLHRVEGALYDDVVGQGWFARRPDEVRLRWRVIGVAVLLAGVFLTVVAGNAGLGLVPAPLALGGLLLVVAAHWMPRRTAKGTAALRHVLGFRRFIEGSEKERARFAERANLFSEYLPYAIVFGCTEKWARAFAGLADGAAATPWYVGGHPFTALGLAAAMDGFTTTTAGSIASVPAGSGGSGFGAGGFAGGGFGGGGGSSW
jgi:uncharacterized membrane protein YgcG